MCDASDYDVGAVLGQREDKKPFMIYYVSKTLDSAQSNYTTMEKEFLVVVFALHKFRSLMSAKLIYVLSSFHMLFCAFNIHIHVKLIKFPLNFVL